MLKKNLTPDHLVCLAGSCPAVYELNDGNLAIIGKKAPAELDRELQGKVADDEFVVVISPEFFQSLPTRS